MEVAARTAIWSGSGKKLPYDAELDYLKGDGASYIFTGVPVWDNVGGKAVARGNVKVNSAVFGVFPSDLANSRFGYSLNDSSGGFSWWGPYAWSAYFITTEWNSFEVNFKNSRRIVAPNQDIAITRELAANGTELTLFAKNRGGNQFYFISKVEIKNVQISVGSEVVRDFIPVRKDGVGYMYDKLNETGGPLGNGLYPNSGTGAFIIGPDKSANGGGYNRCLTARRSWRRVSARSARSSMWRVAA